MLLEQAQAFRNKWWYVIRIKLKHHKESVCEIIAIPSHLCPCTTSKLVVELIVVQVAILAWARSLNCIHVQYNCSSSKYKLHYVKCAISLFLVYNLFTIGIYLHVWFLVATCVCDLMLSILQYALCVSSLLDHITTPQLLDMLLVHSEQPGPCPAIRAITSI